MQIDDPKIVVLIQRVEAACQEIEFAIQLHEAWKPAAFDQNLMGRMSHSYAGNTFLTIRTALRREVILALMRLWDNDTRALNLKSISADLANPDVMNAFATDRASRFPISGAQEGMRKDLQKSANRCRALMAKYLPGGTDADVLLRLRELRNQKLAHRQMTPVASVTPEPARDEVEDLYQDMLELVGRLFSIVKGVAYNLTDTADVFRHYASLFWEPVRSEPKLPRSDGNLAGWTDDPDEADRMPT